MKITTIGLDLAKNVLQIHGVDERGKVIVRKALKREQVIPYFANLPPCLIGMEACGSAHYWGRKLQTLGHTAKLMAPQFVKPYVKTNKNDAADAEAICEAVSRPNMRFVPIKTVEQQAILSLHRGRQGFIKDRTARANQIRGLLAEYGITIPQGIANIKRRLSDILEDGDNGLPGNFRQLIKQLGEHLETLTKAIDSLQDQIEAWHKETPASQRLTTIPGIGPLTASALVATIGDVKQFENSRQLAAWIGLVPRQHSSGGKQTLLGISKRGDSYLRTLLIHGARSVVRFIDKKPAAKDGWLGKLLGRRHKNIAIVALANKNARTVWALLMHDWTYQSDYQRA